MFIPLCSTVGGGGCLARSWVAVVVVNRDNHHLLYIPPAPRAAPLSGGTSYHDHHLPLLAIRGSDYERFV